MKRKVITLMVCCAALAACGVPREAGYLAKAEALRSVPVAALSDEQVRLELQHEAVRWGELRGMLRRKELGGIALVPPQFEDEVARVSALAARQQRMVEEQTDDPALNRQALEAMRRLWREAAVVLGQ